MKVITLMTNKSYGGIQQVSDLVNNKLNAEGITYDNIYIDDFFNSRFKMIKWLKVVKSLTKELIKLSPDVLVSHNKVALICSVFALTKRKVLTLHGPINPENTIGLNYYFIYMINYISCLIADDIVAVSEGLRNELPYFAKKKCIVINNAPSSSFYNDNPISIEFDCLKKFSGIKLVHFGRFHDQKNQSFTLEIVKEMEARDVSFKLVFIGSGADFYKIFERSERMGFTTVEYTQPKDLDNDVIFLSSQKGLSWICDVFDLAIFPSKYEGYPLASKECLSINLPVIHSNCNFGPEEILEEVHANCSENDALRFTIVKSFNANDWVDSIIRSVSSKKLSVHEPYFSKENQLLLMQNKWFNFLMNNVVLRDGNV